MFTVNTWMQAFLQYFSNSFFFRFSQSMGDPYDTQFSKVKVTMLGDIQSATVFKRSDKFHTAPKVISAVLPARICLIAWANDRIAI